MERKWMNIDIRFDDGSAMYFNREEINKMLELAPTITDLMNAIREARRLANVKFSE